MTKTLQRTQTQFTELVSLGRPIFMKETDADYRKSMDLLERNGLRPFTQQEILLHLTQNPELTQKLKGKWFYIAGTGTSLSGYHIIDNDGNLKSGQGDIEKTVYVHKGNQPLSLNVLSDYLARNDGRRFGLNGNDTPDFVARVVLGLPASQAQAAREASAPKIGPDQLESIKSSVAKIETSLEELKQLIRTFE